MPVVLIMLMHACLMQGSTKFTLFDVVMSLHVIIELGALEPDT